MNLDLESEMRLLDHLKKRDDVEKSGWTYQSKV